MSAVHEVKEIFTRVGESHYESGVNHLEHALQTAHLAESEGADNALITAALLHDIGHLILLGTAPAGHAALAEHETVAANWLSSRFSEEVTEVARLHVAAKRYLSALDPKFVYSLSADSRTSLALQGGAFTSVEAEQFLQQKFSQNALRLRRWDDAGKVPGVKTPSLNHFLAIAATQLIQGMGSETETVNE
ncbi:HD domain-containing protein [Rhizobium ruizarguesonis]|uniref:HD domain-containing protein n=1 Tax=Rhizobium ruizarguesonis TaxID=2081791 RepID=UPI0013EE616F|nr:HD domain-containing protein [Rhizobium ruizarguesonis]